MGKYDQYRKQQGTQQSKYSDIINKYKKKEADKDMGLFWTAKQQIWEVASQVYQGIKNIPKETGLIWKTWWDFQKRAENINQNNATMPMWDRKTLRNAGQLLGAANDFIGNAFVSWIKTFVPKSLRDSSVDLAKLWLKTAPWEAIKDTATKAYEQWKAFEKKNPELAKDLWAVGNIANFALNFVWGSQAGKIKPTGMIDDAFSKARWVADDVVKKTAPTIQSFASKVPWQVDNLATGTGEVGISAATGLSREAQQIIKKQPWLYQQARQGTITREAVTDDVVGALSKRMDDISDLWKGYETIRTSTITVPKNDIANIAVSHLDDMKVSKIDLPIGDRGTVQKALDYIRELPDTMTAQNALSLRRKFDDLINWKSEATWEGKRIIRGMRAKIDEYLGGKLPWLKELDRKYWPEREFIDKVKGTILDKQWNLKDGAISSVANMIGKGKEMKLDKFEKLLPWIGDKVRALKAFEEIQNLAQIKTWSVARQIFSFAVGWIPWFVATNPYVVGYALEKYGFAKEAIKRILSKGKKISEAEAKAVHRAVKSVSKKEVEKIIDAKVGTPLLPAGKSSVATGNTGGKLPPADLTPNASTWNAVSSQARISPPQSAWLLDSPKKTINGTKEQTIKPVVKSPWEKVIPPIIPKSQPKAKLRTNEDAFKKAKITKVDSELESLQKSQQTQPTPITTEVPSDYSPTDWLPTWTEFESTALPTATKGKIPSPDIKRPQIRGIDLGIRSNMIDSLGEQGIFTDSFFAITDKPLATKFIDYAKTKAIKKWQPLTGKSPDIKSLMETAKRSADTPLVPKEYVKWLDWDKGIYLRFDIGDGNKVAVNSSYTDIFFKNFDDVTFKWNNELSPVVVLSKWEPVWVIMPIKDVYSLKGKLGDFSMQSKTPQVEGKTAMETKLDATINKKLIEEAKNHTDFVDFFQSKLWDKQPTKENLMELWFSAEDIARNTDSLWISLEDLFHEIKTWKLSSYPAKSKPSPLSQKSEVKYSEPDLASEASWKGLQEKNPDLFNTGILRKSKSPMNAKGIIPDDVHSAQGKWHNLGQNSEVPAKTIYKRIDSGSFKGEYEDKLWNPIREENGSILQDMYDEATGEWIEPMVSNKELKSHLLESFSTKEWKRYLDEVIAALPKDKDWLVTAYRIWDIWDGTQSYTLSEWLAKTFSHQWTDIPLPWTPYLPAKWYEDFGALKANKVKINPKWIKAWSPYDAEILVEWKYVKK